MRRFIPTLIVLLVVLVAGGALILQPGGGGATSSSAVLPMVLGSLAALVGLLALGYVIALAFNQVARLVGRMPDVQPEAPKAGAAKPTNVFLYDRQSLTVFSIATLVVVLGFLITRAVGANVPAGYPLDRAPDLTGVLFTLPFGDGFDVLEWQALVGLVVAALVSIVIVAFILARLAESGEAATRKLEAAAAPATAAAKPAPAAKPAAGAEKVAPPVPFLYDNRQRLVFYILVGIGALAFLLVRWLATSTPLAYPLDGTVTFDSVVMTLPGDPIVGWPEGMPGPGQPLLVWQGLLGLAGAIVSVAVVGWLLARGVAALDARVRADEKATGQWPAPQVARLEAALTTNPAQPRRLSGLDQLIIVLLGAIVLLALVWVVPTLSGMFAVDASLEQTRVASFWTPTPLPGPTPTPGPSPDEAVAGLPAGDAASGEALVAAQGCIACHIPNPDTPDAVLAGPAWVASAAADGKGVAAHADERFTTGDYTGQATSAAAYLYESIVNPGAYVVPAYVAGVMPPTYASTLTEQNLADIIAYLQTVE